ncbi:MAG: cytochrome c [Woeseiaceae bacterium]|nr:cytochrome c [Woeseiaceae bacterium]
MKRAALLLVLAAVLAGWWILRPTTWSESELPAHSPDVKAGEKVFWAGGCASCHATPVNGRRAKGADRLLLGGGAELDTPFGVFRMPNISPHESDGIGGWSDLDFVNAMQLGVSPSGQHYYPSFPYASYARMKSEEVLDLFAFLKQLEPVASDRPEHELKFPWNLRNGIGVWKRLYLDPAPVIDLATDDARLKHGQALVEGAGHCGECHTPRDSLGGMDKKRWLTGAPNLEGRGSVPNITPMAEGFGDWSESDIVYYLETGFTPDFDAVGGSMVAVQENMAMLDAADREAIARYLKALPTGPQSE